MTTATTAVQNIDTYTKDITTFITQIPGALAGRVVMLCEDMTRVAGSPEALKETIRCVMATAQLITDVPQKSLEFASTITTTISAWKLTKSINYFAEMKFFSDLKGTKACSVIAEAFFLVGRAGVCVVWITENIGSLAAVSSLLGGLPIFGTLVAAGAVPVMNVAFLGGCLFLLVDRSRAFFKGGYVGDADEAMSRDAVERDFRRSLPANERNRAFTAGELAQVNGYMSAKSYTNVWLAAADMIALTAESALIAFSFSPVISLGVDATAGLFGMLSTAWDREPGKRKFVAAAAA